MQTRPPSFPTPAHASAQPPVHHALHSAPAQVARHAPLHLAQEPSSPSSDPGAIEYASWLRLLRQPAL